MKHHRQFLGWLFALFISTALPDSPAQTASPAPAGTGTIVGRVLNVATGSYLTNARISVEGTNILSFSARDGAYVLGNVPVGTAMVQVTYTGLEPLTESIDIAPGSMVSHDFSLRPAGKDELVKLDSFQVEESKIMDQMSISSQAEHFAPNLISVVSTDQYGLITTGGVGDIFQYLPGVATENADNLQLAVMIRGVNPVYTGITMDGNPVANAAGGALTRTVILYETFLLNNFSRIETDYSRTPDTPAGALGGSINYISRSAFDQNHMTVDFRLNDFVDSQAMYLGKKYAFGGGEKSGNRPGGAFTLVDPVSSKFGFTASFVYAWLPYEANEGLNFWAPNAVAGAGSNLLKPYDKQYEYIHYPEATIRESADFTFDFKLSDRDTLFVHPSWTYFDQFFDEGITIWNTEGQTNTAPAAFDPTFTQGATGAGSVLQQDEDRDLYGTNSELDLAYTHLGPVWTVNMGASYSNDSFHVKDAENGYTGLTLMTMSNVTIGLNGINTTGAKPAGLTVTNASGAPVDWTQIANYNTLGSISNDHKDASSTVKDAHLDIKRSMGGAFPTDIKAGVSYEDVLKDTTAPGVLLTYNGPSNILQTNAAQLLNTAYYNANQGFNFPHIQYLSNYGAWQLYQHNPNYFTWAPSNITTAAQGSNYLQENIGAAYIMGDTRMVHNRLRLVYGIRFERTDDLAEANLTNPNAQYVQSNGQVVLTNGKPTPLTAPNGLPISDPSNAILLAQTINSARGQVAKSHYAGGYPSMNASFDITPELVARATYYRGLGRPDYSLIVPTLALPAATATGAAQYALTVANTALKPEQDDNVDLDLEWYFGKHSFITIGGYGKWFTNFFASSTVADTPELLSQYNVPNPSFYLQNNGTITTNFNSGEASVTGIQVAYQQDLSFLPLPGFSIFANGFKNHLTGSQFANFQYYVSSQENVGLAYDHRHWQVNANLNHRGRERQTGTLTTDSLGQQNYMFLYYQPRTELNGSVAYRVTRHVKLFTTFANLFNTYYLTQQYGLASPSYSYSKETSNFGVTWSFGLEGSF